MTDTQVLYANIASNVVAVLMLLLSWRWRNVGRFLFFALFLWAAQVNMRVAIWNAHAYLDFARWAVQPYRDFILGPFARHTGVIVGAIAVGQLAIAILEASRGRAVALGLAGAILFLLAIAPLAQVTASSDDVRSATSPVSWSRSAVDAAGSSTGAGSAVAPRWYPFPGFREAGRG